MIFFCEIFIAICIFIFVICLGKTGLGMKCTRNLELLCLKISLFNQNFLVATNIDIIDWTLGICYYKFLTFCYMISWAEADLVLVYPKGGDKYEVNISLWNYI